jgi:hypothetical protein
MNKMAYENLPCGCGQCRSRRLQKRYEEEIGFGHQSNQSEHEFAVSGSCTVIVQQVREIPLRRFKAIRPKNPGIYFIHVGDRIWYVGKAEGGIWDRFRKRALALKDFGLKGSDLTPKNIRITYLIPIIAAKCGSLFFVQRKGAAKSLPNRKVTHAKELIPLLEQYFIKEYGTHLLGNLAVEPITLSPGTAITIKTMDGTYLGTINKSIDLSAELKARRDVEDIFDAEMFEAYGESEIESETKIIMDSYAREHLRIRASRFPNTSALRLIQNRINKLLGMYAPPEAMGNYSWYVEVPGVPGAKIIFRDNMIRTVLSANERYPANAALYRIENGRLARA